jgi:hypothetical protein
VPVVDLVERIVVELEEVVAGDIVDVAVAVGVGAVGEEEDQVLRILLPVAVRVGHGRVGVVVRHVEDPVAVAVARVAARGRGARAARCRQLAGVQMVLPAEIGERAAVAPADARVVDGDHDVGPSRRQPPGDLDAHPAHAEELVRARQHERVGGAEARARVLPLVVVAAAGGARHLVRQRDAAERQARGVAAIRIREEGKLGTDRGQEEEDERARAQQSTVHGPPPAPAGPPRATRKRGVLPRRWGSGARRRA